MLFHENHTERDCLWSILEKNQTNECFHWYEPLIYLFKKKVINIFLRIFNVEMNQDRSKMIVRKNNSVKILKLLSPHD